MDKTSLYFIIFYIISSLKWFSREGIKLGRQIVCEPNSIYSKISNKNEFGQNSICEK